MAGLIVLGGGILAGEVIAVPIGGYVASNYISTRPSWTAFTIGAVSTAVIFPVVAFTLVEAYGSYYLASKTPPKKDDTKPMGIQPS
jgi:nitrate reductase NapE component